MTNKLNTQDDAEATHHTWRNLFLYLLSCELAVVLVFWLWTLGKQFAWRTPTVVADAETIQQIHFVDGLLMNTQVDTDVIPWLVEGVTKWLLGTRLETREDFFNRQIFVV